MRFAVHIMLCLGLLCCSTEEKETSSVIDAENSDDSTAIDQDSVASATNGADTNDSETTNATSSDTSDSSDATESATNEGIDDTDSSDTGTVSGTTDNTSDTDSTDTSDDTSSSDGTEGSDNADGTDNTDGATPSFENLCKPCKEDSDCEKNGDANAKCLSNKNMGSFCGGDCSELSCPEGFDCQVKIIGDGETGMQCVPNDGACKCKPEWADLNLVTECVASNKFGICYGERTCTENGLSECDAKEPSEELCDGIDNNCSGAIDDIAETGCDDGLECTIDVCEATGACSNSIDAGSCAINGACYANNAKNPTNDCQACNIDNSQVTWTLLNDNACDDGDPCTKNDVCKEGLCAGTPLQCDDNLECTIETCDGNSCKSELKPDTCLIEGKCYLSGESASVNKCGSCNPQESTSKWSVTIGASCDDGNVCTTNTQCDAQAQCTGGTKKTCDDGLSCTKASCDPEKGCKFDVEKGCLINGVCHETGAINSKNPCETCNPKKSDAAWTKIDGGSCIDGDACTKGDVCVKGTCSGKAYSCDDGKSCTKNMCDGKGGCNFPPIANGDGCDDGNSCTVNDTCSGGSCTGQPKDCSALDADCSTGVCSPANGVCQAKPKNGGPCQDGNPCTKEDICTQGTCMGTLYACASGDNPCIEAKCNGLGGCNDIPLPNGIQCSDGSACTSKDECKNGQCVGETKDCSGVADQCNTGICTEAGTCTQKPAPGACDDFDECTTNDQCTNGKCGGTPIDNCKPSPPPTNGPEAIKWLQAKKYQNWPSESGPHQSAGPHGKVRTFFNAVLVDSFQKNNASHPIGAASVKELYSGNTITGWALMVKTQEDSAKGQGWYWYEKIGNSIFADGNGVSGCHLCHSSGKDYVLTPFPLK